MKSIFLHTVFLITFGYGRGQQCDPKVGGEECLKQWETTLNEFSNFSKLALENALKLEDQKQKCFKVHGSYSYNMKTYSDCESKNKNLETLLENEKNNFSKRKSGVDNEMLAYRKCEQDLKTLKDAIVEYNNIFSKTKKQDLVAVENDNECPLVIKKTAELIVQEEREYEKLKSELEKVEDSLKKCDEDKKFNENSIESEKNKEKECLARVTPLRKMLHESKRIEHNCEWKVSKVDKNLRAVADSIEDFDDL